MSKPSTAAGSRLYAVGDIHGRLDLLGALLAKIEVDVAERMACRTQIVLLGDLIDRGPNSRQVLELAKTATQLSDDVVVLLGNHEELLLASASGNVSAQRVWLQNGGDATLASFGVDIPDLTGMSSAEMARLITDTVGEGVLAWLEVLPLSHHCGDYFFCHAGVRPGIPLCRQRREDLLWIRSTFLTSARDHGAVIVHGHSEADEPLISHNRINLDTAAYRTGRLTALGLQDSELWLLSSSSSTT